MAFVVFMVIQIVLIDTRGLYLPVRLFGTPEYFHTPTLA